MAFRCFSNSQLLYGDITLPLENLRSIPPYGLVYSESEPSQLLAHAQLYTLENIKDKPDLLKPLNCSLLNPSDYDIAQKVYQLNEIGNQLNNEK